MSLSLLIEGGAKAKAATDGAEVIEKKIKGFAHLKAEHANSVPSPKQAPPCEAKPKGLLGVDTIMEQIKETSTAAERAASREKNKTPGTRAMSKLLDKGPQ